MVTTLSKLVDMIQSGAAVPAWFRNQVTANREQITNALLEDGIYVFHGPSGETIEIRAERQVAA